MPNGILSPGIRSGFTVAPEVVNLPILPLSLVTFEIETNKSSTGHCDPRSDHLTS